MSLFVTTYAPRAMPSAAMPMCNWWKCSGLAFANPCFCTARQRLALHRLDLDDMLGLRRFEEADADRVDLAAQPAAGEREALLLAADLDTGAPEIGQHTFLLEVAALEDPQLPAGRPLRRRGPTKRQPELPVARRAQRRGADAVALVGRARIGRGLGLAGAPDRVDGGLGRGREGDHQAAPPPAPSTITPTAHAWRSHRRGRSWRRARLSSRRRRACSPWRHSGRPCRCPGSPSPERRAAPRCRRP